MKLSFATLGCPGWSLPQIAANAKSLGYAGVELRGQNNGHIGPDATMAERQVTRALFEDAGVEIPALMGYTNFVQTDPTAVQQQNDGAMRLVDLARALGSPVVRIFFGEPADETGEDELVARVSGNVKPAVAYAAEAGVTLAVETHDAWTKGERVRRVLEAVDSPGLGVCWDVCNSFFVEPVPVTFNALRDRVCHVHLKDERRTDGKPAPVLPGTGQADLALAVNLLKEAGYNGYYSFEWEKWWHPALAEPEVAFPAYKAFCDGLKR